MAWNEPDDNKKEQDPWRDKKEPAPPDLDEALKKLQQKLRQILGIKPSQGKLNRSRGKNFLSINLGIIAAALFALWILSGIFIVGPAERAVILRFGKYADTVGPGPHWLARFIETKYVVDVEKVSTFSYTAEMLNKDENIVSVSVAVQYRISNLRDYLFNVVNPIESLQQATASSLRQVIGHTTLDEILTVGREKVRQEVFDLLQQVLVNYSTGIVITDVTMLPAKAPEEVKSAFDDAIKAQEDEQRFINQAYGYTASVEPIARGKAQRIVQEAKAYKEKVILQAKGDASRFLAMLAEYQQSPEVTRERLYIDALQSVLSQSSKILLDTNGSNNVLYLPLDKMGQRSPRAPVSEVDNNEGSNGSNSATTNVNTVENANTQLTNKQSEQTDQSQRLDREGYSGREIN